MELQEFTARTIDEMNKYVAEKEIKRSQIISLCRNNNRLVLLYEVKPQGRKK